MRLHRLEVTAFGPFARSAVVDFDALATDGLFVLSGATGAGKTTILDAVAFALYGTVPGQRRESRRLHSDHADADVSPQVVLEATLSGRRVRLSRSPEHARPKKRGDGFRTEPARATLTWLDGGRTNLTRITEIGDEVVRLLGMSADQFFQVVLLPQGDFARFLSAQNDDREQLLERLFDTERFGDAEAWLAARRRDSEGALERYRNTLHRLGAQISTAAGIDVPAEMTAAWSESVLADARSFGLAAAEELSRTRDTAATAERDQREGRSLAEAHLKLTEARRLLAELARAEPELAAAAAELAAARRAETVRAANVDAERAAGIAARAHGERGRVEVRMPSPAAVGELAQLSWPPADGDAERIDRQLHYWAAELGRLRDVERDVAAVRTSTAKLAATAAERGACRHELAELTAEADTLPAELESAREYLSVAQARAADVDTLAAQHEVAIGVVAAAREYVSCAAALASQRSIAADARRAHLDAREHVLHLRERRLAGMAAELADSLSPGDPCAVCGSREHPAPARAEGAVSVAVERAAAVAETSAAAARERADEAVADTGRRLQELASRGGAGNPADLRATADAIHVRLRTARAATASVGELTARVGELVYREADLAARIKRCADRLAALDVEVAEMRGRIEEVRARIAESGGDENLTDRLSRLAALSRTAIALRDARAAAHAADAEVARTVEHLAASTAEAGFGSVAEALAAVRPPSRLGEIETIQARSVTQRARAEAIRADPGVRAASGSEMPDMAALDARREAATTALDAAIAHHATASERVRQLEDLAAQFWAAHDRLAPAEEAHRELVRIADIVAGRGTNTRRMSLRSYVLAARLEEVVIAASHRLRRMSAGRYEFVHSDSSGPRGRRGGLGLEIRDDYTGATRPTGSLSGGETFTASLALALGLADVVAAESGGRVLDTLFIDEGFGSLDDETLDSVMGVLDELRAGGRVVGIVSHVDEIRQRIPNRLHVIRDRSGSRLECRVG